MRAKLPTTYAPGTVSKNFVEFSRRGDVVLYALEEDPDNSIVSVLVGDLMVPVAFPDQLKRQPDAVPGTHGELLEMLREGALASDRLAHRLVWTALGLPTSEWERRHEEMRQRREARQKERDESFERQKREANEKEEKYVAEMVGKVLSGDTVTGKELYDLALHLGIKVAPSTAGSLKNGNVVGVTSDRGSGTTKAIIHASVRLYRQVEGKLKERSP
jgi:hypothetical protein